MKKVNKISIAIVVLGVIFVFSGFILKAFDISKGLPLAFSGLLLDLIGMILLVFPPRPFREH